MASTKLRQSLERIDNGYRNAQNVYLCSGVGALIVATEVQSAGAYVVSGFGFLGASAFKLIRTKTTSRAVKMLDTAIPKVPPEQGIAETVRSSIEDVAEEIGGLTLREQVVNAMFNPARPSLFPSPKALLILEDIAPGSASYALERAEQST